jgi:hypothetical protein
MSDSFNVIGCRAQQPTEVELLAYADAGVTGAPYPGSIDGVCVSCQRDVWVGPRQVKAMEDLDDPMLMCITCAIMVAREYQQATDNEPQIISLGNVHPDDKEPVS